MPTPLARIRAAGAADLDWLVDIEARCFETDRVSRRSFRAFLTGESAMLRIIEADGQRLGYSLVLFRRSTALARLYSIAVLPEMTGRGLAAVMLAAAEGECARVGKVVMRLEVATDNVPAQRLYARAGYRAIRTMRGYYEDGSDALRMEKSLRAELSLQPAVRVPYYGQTTEFTCGPACLMMVSRYFRPGFRMNAATEVRLWREATTVFMTRGLGGCEPWGMAVALAESGLRVELCLSEAGPLLLNTVGKAEKRRVMRIAQADFRRRAGELQIPVVDAIDVQTLADSLSPQCLAIVLISSNRMFGVRVPHWVVVHQRIGEHLLIHDPWMEPDQFETAVNAANLPVPIDEFARMSRYGKSGLRAALLIRDVADSEGSLR